MTDTVDGAVEEVETIVNAVECVGTYDFEEEFLSGVVHDGHVVGVPTDGAGNVEHQFLQIGQHGRYLVGRRLCGVIVAGVDGQNLVVLCSVGGVEVMRTNGE